MTRKELVENIRSKGSFLCVGLDSDIEKLPDCLKGHEDAVFTFNKAIIDATAPYCVAYKPNAAFYESRGAQGVIDLERTIAYIKDNYPDQLVILDAKRGDIGNTSKMYAKSAYEHLHADAVTIAPYMGEDSVKPFLDYDGKWAIVLALTSNKGSHDFQLIEDKDGKRLFEQVIETSSKWGSEDDMMYVVGATQGRMFEDIRRVAPRHFLLVPGVGAQGGSLEDVCKYGMIDDCGLLINSSRGIIFASKGDDYAKAAADAAKSLRDQMSALL